jgi:hypothetical protein
MDAGDDDIIDGENGSNGVTSTSMSDDDIQQILRQFNTKYAKSKNAGVSIVTNSFTHSHILLYPPTHSFTCYPFRPVYFMLVSNQQ